VPDVCEAGGLEACVHASILPFGSRPPFASRRREARRRPKAAILDGQPTPPGQSGKLGVKPTRFRHCKRGARVLLDRLERSVTFHVRGFAASVDGKTRTRAPIRESGDLLPQGRPISLGATTPGRTACAHVRSDSPF
jgi:hypothetical protein